jgi:hypothetical protein
MKISSVITTELFKAKLENWGGGGTYYLNIDISTLIVTTTSPAHNALQDLLMGLKAPLSEWAQNLWITNLCNWGCTFYALQGWARMCAGQRT